jgi:DNA-binding NtrC family response regulator
VLQEREFEPVGSNRSVRVDVRIICATNRNLEESISEGTFRSDLYYRLNVICIQLPPLRDRREDIPLLAQHFIKKFCGNIETKTVSQDAMKMLMSYSWPGNIRQLENAIERAVALLGTRNIVLPSDLPTEIQDSKTHFLLSDVFIPDEGIDLYGRIALLEKELTVLTEYAL